MRDLVCAVDVGSSSARAGIFAADGQLLGRAQHPITTRRPGPNRAEQSSAEIWRAVCRAVRAAVEASGADVRRIVGLGFDATCSLVIDRDGTSGREETEWDTIAWSDHRAAQEAAICTATAHAVLSRLGGSMSPEMQIPKIMWLKRNEPERWAATTGLFDLSDFLTWRATGSRARSHCTLTSKWCYLADREGIQDDFLAEIGLGDFSNRAGLPNTGTGAGIPVGGAIDVLQASAVSDLGLPGDCIVAAGMVDGFAGGIGALAHLREPVRHAALVAGTSTCIMCLSHEPRCVPGVWGPYRDAAVPGYWVVEGGQSATGALLDHIVRQHGLEPDETAHRRIAAHIETGGSDFARGVHVLPDFNGNRTPLAEPGTLGVVTGLDLDDSFDGLCRLYWRCAVGLALGLRQIVEHVVEHGATIEGFEAAGGHCCNPLLMQLYADATGLPVAASPEGETVLRGTAITAAVAAGLHADISAAGVAMATTRERYQPSPEHRERLDSDYRVFLRMQEHRREIAEMACT